MTREAREALLRELRALQLRAKNAEDDARAYVATLPESDQHDHNIRRATELGWIKGTLCEIAGRIEIVLAQLAIDDAYIARDVRMKGRAA